MDKEAQEKANIILKQLGGTKFITMTGAQNFSIVENGMSFKLPNNFAKDNINYVKIVLNNKDLYDIEYGLIKNFEYLVVKKEYDLYNDQLQHSFTENTGLHTKL